jgi:RNA polymerase sigma-70 factor (ECF subfamily)
LRVVAGLSVHEVAAALGKRPGAIRTAQSRALAKLREELGS